MAHAHTFDRLLTTLYAAPTQPEMWNTFLQEFGEISSVNKAALISHRFDVNSTESLPLWATASKIGRTSVSMKSFTARSTNGRGVSPKETP